ncbi:hypothetical protein [Clostridium ljungdahlii]|uniref:Uncharacterized protein n=1 Tax=Clostridium ljungdahlii (strain ATCC 55383 / DSM 13528 / PETC) TaxID=748727 RepID=D8GQP9_CLOLD|nr:hypothetical protein [Clostridium ljungdahlii]ADK16204.1 hypothetical protein CLJU_c31560 [Clostridium ljungdahlii DSM 13528]OAA89926.1 hypothetical protein WX45_01765 [Clostridium ljungdahlii DSM 13528]
MFRKNNKQGKNTSIYGIIDERTKSVVYQGDAYACRFMMFATLLDIFIRGLNLSNSLIESNFDLILIVIIGGLISTAYQIKNKVISYHSSARSFIVIAVFTAFIAFLITFFYAK